MDETQGFGCLGHSNWTICSMLSQFCSLNFPFFSLSYWREANSYYPTGLIMRKGNSPNSRNGLNRGVWVPGTFKLDHLQPAKPILFSKFYNFSTFILGANSYYPREGKAENGKMDFSQPECERGIWVPGAFRLDHLQPVEPILFPKISNFYTFILGPFLLTPEG